MQPSFLSNETQATIASGDALDVRSVRVTEGVSMLFRIELTVLSANDDIDFREIVGRPATVRFTHLGHVRSWDGVVDDIVQTRVESIGVSTYELTVVPKVWLATQRQNYRVFQNLSELDVVKKMLGEQHVRFDDQTQQAYHRRSFILQYGESDFAFMSRMLESVGVSYAFSPTNDGLSMVLYDAPESQTPSIATLPFYDEPPDHAPRWVSKLSVRQRVRPGKHRVQDLDYRRPSNAQPALESSNGLPQEEALEVMEWDPGAFLFETGLPEETPAADDRGIPRTDTTAGQRIVQGRLLAARSSARVIAFVSPNIDLMPGQCLTITDHPHREVQGKSLLVIRAVIEGAVDLQWRSHVECATTDQPYRPSIVTPKPRIVGVESAVVVGPGGEDIHTDEFARVRIQFHWDREGARDERSSCWVAVNQPWGGAGFGAINLPRVGQEVLVEFVSGDPDRPIIIGRVFTKTQPPPYKLPGFKQVSGLRSATSTGLEALATAALTAAGQKMLGGPSQPLAPSALHEALQHPYFKAQSPDTSTHQWSGNELTFYDQPAAQQLYMQAEKDMNVVVKNATTAVVGNSRSANIGTDDVLVVGNRQSTTVVNNQSVHIGENHYHVVGGYEWHTTTGDINITTYENLNHKITEKWSSEADIQEHEATNLTVLKVGNSRIVMRPEFIIIQSTDVFINPGDADTDAAIADGTRPKPETEKREEAAQEAASREQALRDRATGLRQEQADYEQAQARRYNDPTAPDPGPMSPAEDAGAYMDAHEADIEKFSYGYLEQQVITGQRLPFSYDELVQGHFNEFNGAITMDQARANVDALISGTRP